MTVLDGKAVVFTGSGRGIGAACARSAASEGAKVVINDVAGNLVDKVVAEIREEGGQAIGFACDVSSSAEALKLISCCCDSFGRIDGLVNNAALIKHHSIDEMDEQDIDALLRVNVMGTIHCGRHAVARMKAQDGNASIVNVTSGSQMGLAGASVYSATKGAVASLTYSWALELDGSPIRVNAVSPYAETRMSQATDAFRHRKGEPARAAALPEPAANAPLVNFLLSDLSEGIIGQVFRLAGDELNTVTHPALLCPPAVRRDWSAQKIDAILKAELSGMLQPLGYQSVVQRPV
ncbi:SDR family NAD(P)-dependent oxidoreductase [Propylenella binzhouense]|uniref:SDR family NAD(P)-dependent oxidoreductase n=1 Tax=Propylenella binzhouense TaxID=2555902 RepID=UPI00136FB8A6|nr:SDR family oxidoreductase [Propylenella binzhouense]